MRKRGLTECKEGHPLSGDNLYVLPDGSQRRCRTCLRNRMARSRGQVKPAEPRRPKKIVVRKQASFIAFTAAPEMAEALWSRVEKQPSGCWEWRGTRFAAGYGSMYVPSLKRNLYAHRVAYTLANGSIPVGLIVRHRCDNPPCCNPDHIEVGTFSDNTQDAIRRGRWTQGANLRGRGSRSRAVQS